MEITIGDTKASIIAAELQRLKTVSKRRETDELEGL